MKKVIVLIIVIAAFISKKSIAQEYNSAIGARLGVPLGISYKTFLGRGPAFEGILTFVAHENVTRVGFTGLLEFHMELADRLSFLYGFGGHISSGPVIGIDGIIGLDYAFDAIPFNLTLDWKPALNLIHQGTSVSPAHFALSVRYYW